MGEAFNIEYLTDYKELIADPNIDAVSIVTPPHTHYALAKEFMEAGKERSDGFTLVEQNANRNPAQSAA